MDIPTHAQLVERINMFLARHSIAPSRLGREVTGLAGALLRLVLAARPGPAAGAATAVYLASSPEVAEVTGGYFVKRKPARPSTLATDPQAAARLWALSEQLAGLPPSR